MWIKRKNLEGLKQRVLDLENANRSLRAELRADLTTPALVEEAVQRTKRAIADRQEAEVQLGQMSDRLHELQVTIEVQAEALERKDRDLGEMLNEIREALGGDGVRDRGGVLARIRQIREAADSFTLVRDVLAGRFDPDATLLRRLACALGSGSFELDSVMDRANTLAQAHIKNAELFRALQVSQQKVEEQRDELRDLTGDPDYV